MKQNLTLESLENTICEIILKGADVGEGTADKLASRIVKQVARYAKPYTDACAGIAAPETTVPDLASLVEEFLCDQETLKVPVRNEAICEKARAALAKVTRSSNRRKS